MIPIHLTNNGPKNFALISFKPHNVCNYTCDYCHPNSNDGSERWNSNYTAVADFVNKVREKNKYACLEIIGGEPTLWPELQLFMEKTSHDNLMFEISTNGSRTLRYWEQFKPSNSLFVFSWHPKEVDTDHLVKVIEVMKDKCFPMVSLLITPDSWEKGLDAINKFEKLNIFIDIKLVRKSLVNSELYPYTTSQLDYIDVYSKKPNNIIFPKWLSLYPKDIILNGIQKNWNNLVTDKKNIFTDWKCNAGIDRFVIDPNGDISRCWPRVGGKIGNVYSGYTLPTEPITCTYKYECHCKQDAVVEKWSPNYV
jgi:sulfatase maturation enzyme AslB (radical SAM superfamily)